MAKPHETAEDRERRLQSEEHTRFRGRRGRRLRKSLQRSEDRPESLPETAKSEESDA